MLAFLLENLQFDLITYRLNKVEAADYGSIYYFRVIFSAVCFYK